MPKEGVVRCFRVFVESSAVGLLRFCFRTDRGCCTMPEVREDDVLILLKNVAPAVPKRESKLKDLIEDLTWMGCEGLLAKPWNLRSEAILREFLSKRGNQWERTMRQVP